MNDLKVSIIIPAYNEENYIGRCLDHVMEHAASRVSEIIVVDNASTDRTAEIAASYPGVRVIHEPNKGITFARQCGYLNASGDILAFLDADTAITKSWYQKMIKGFRNPKCVCVSGPYVFYDAPMLQQQVAWLYWMFAMPVYWVIGYMVVGGNFAIKRSALEQIGGFDTSIAFYGEDTNIARRAHAVGKVRFMMSFYIHTSARRMQSKGWITIGWTYVKNFVSEVIARKPATTTYDDIR